MQDLIFEIIQSVLVVILGYLFSKGKKTKTYEEIEATEETKKQKRIAKQLKKNKLKPIDSQGTSEEVNQAVQKIINDIGDVNV